MHDGRIIIGGTGSNAGKTTVTMALILDLINHGISVKSYKAGPDYIDPGFHSRITGIPCDNIDAWMMPEERIVEMISENGKNFDMQVIEGVMGLYDGVSGLSDSGSTADLARILKTPVILVIDISGMGRSAAAVAEGFVHMADGFSIAAFILNRVGSAGHYSMVKEAVESVTGIPVIGYVENGGDLELRSRHLGLVQSNEYEDMNGYYDSLRIRSHFDTGKIMEISGMSGQLSPVSGKAKKSAMPDVTIAVAYDEAFDFYYEENLRMLREQGAKIVYFSPLKNEKIPDTADGLYIGGGFPEVFARKLAENKVSTGSIRDRILNGLPTYAECGGYMFLCRNIILKDGTEIPGAGIIPASAAMTDKLTMGYREIKAIHSSIIMENGDTARGHEFHYSDITDHMDVDHPFMLKSGSREKVDGFFSPNVVASYAHIHFASNERIPENFARSCRDYAMNKVRQGKS